MKTEGGCYNKTMEAVTHPVYEGRAAGALRVVLSPPVDWEKNKSGTDSARRVKNSHVDLKKKGTNQEQTSFQHTHTNAATAATAATINTICLAHFG